MQTEVQRRSIWARIFFAQAEHSTWESRLARDLALLGARVYAGVTIAKAGFDKLPTPDWMTDQVLQIGWFPAASFFAMLACLTEAIGGVLLVAGLLTRFWSMALAVTLGVAAFGFHQVTPLTGMHITQGFFWLFVVTAVFGPGRFSLDQVLHQLGAAAGEKGRGARLAWMVALVGVTAATVPACYWEFVYQPAAEEATADIIETMSVAGSFSDWDLRTSPMQPGEGSTWTCKIAIEQAGPVEFKFAANQSWDINLGDNDQDAVGMPAGGTGDPGGENIQAYIPKSGSYVFSVDTETYAYQVAPAGD